MVVERESSLLWKRGGFSVHSVQSNIAGTKTDRYDLAQANAL